MVQVPPWQRPSSAPAPPQGAPGGSRQRGTPRARPGHWAPSHCLGSPPRDQRPTLRGLRPGPVSSRPGPEVPGRPREGMDVDVRPRRQGPLLGPHARTPAGLTRRDVKLGFTEP
eukprot:scaffold29488_cov41-Phaeocystis_antarctica.AAC.2